MVQNLCYISVDRKPLNTICDHETNESPTDENIQTVILQIFTVISDHNILPHWYTWAVYPADAQIW